MSCDNGRAIHHHGLRFNQMDNPGRFGSPTSKPCDARSTNETELGELKAAPEIAARIIQGVPCRDGGCKRGVKARPEHRLESPWHYLKTLFLVSMIVALLIWIVVYVLLSQYDVL